MDAIYFPEAEGFIGKPPDMSEEECGSLAVVVGQWKEYPCIVSAWKPTEEELARLNDGGAVYLHVLGSRQPPVLLSTQIEADVEGGAPHEE